MNRWYSVLGLLFSILVVAENSTKILNNVLQNNSKPMNINSNHSAIKKKTIFLNKEFFDMNPNIYNLNITKTLDKLNPSTTNQLLGGKIVRSKDAKSVNCFQRHVQKTFHKNNKDDISGRHIKVLLDRQPENKKEIYDIYDYRKYYDNYQKKNNDDPMIDDYILNSKEENSSNLITKTLGESQKIKRCVKKNMQNSGSNNIYSTRKLLSGNIKDGRKSILACRDCPLIKSNKNPIVLKSSHKKNVRLKQINENYLINVLKQLIDKLKNPNSIRSNYYKDVLSQERNELISLENELTEQKITNRSFEEDRILKIKKMEENRMIEKLNSSIENTFVNGNWTKNKTNDFKSVVKDLKSKFNDKNQSISKSDKSSNKINPENINIKTNADISNNFYHLQIGDTEKNKEYSTSPLLKENDISKIIVKPLYLSNPFTNDSKKIEIRNKINLNADLLKKNQKTYLSSNKNYIEEPKLIISQEPKLIIHDNQLKNTMDNKINKNTKNVSSKDIILNTKSKNVQLMDQRINNYKENINNEIKMKKLSIIPKNLTQESSKQFFENIKQQIPKKNDKYVGHKFEEYNNVNIITINEKISNTSKSPALIVKNVIGQSTPRNIAKELKDYAIHSDEITTIIPRKMNINLKHNVSTNSNLTFVNRIISQTSPGNKSEYSKEHAKYDDNITTTIQSKMNIKLKYEEPINFNTQAQNKINSQTLLKNLPEELRDYTISDDHITKKISRKVNKKLKNDIPINLNSQILNKTISQIPPRNILLEKSRERPIDGANITTMIPRKINTNTKYVSFKNIVPDMKLVPHKYEEYNNIRNIKTNDRISKTPNSSNKILKRVISKSTPRGLVEELRDYRIHDDNIIKKIPRKMNNKIKYDKPINSNTKILSQTIPTNIPKELRNHTINDDRIIKITTRKVNKKLKYDVPTNFNTLNTLNTIFTHSSSRNIPEEYRRGAIDDDHITTMIPIKMIRNTKNVSFQDIIPNIKLEHLKLVDQRKNNFKENIKDKIKIKNISLIPKNLAQESPRKFFDKLKQYIPPKNDTYVAHKFEEYNNKITINESTSTTPSLSQILKKVISKSTSQNITKKLKDHEMHDDNITKNTPRKINDKLNHDVPTKSNIQFLSTIIAQTSPRNIAKELRDRAIHGDSITNKIPKNMNSKLKHDIPTNSNTQISNKINNQISSQNISKVLREHTRNSDKITKNTLKKTNTKLIHAIPTNSTSLILNTIMSKKSPKNISVISIEHTIDGNHITKMIPKKTNINLKLDVPINFNTQTISTIISQTSPRNIPDKSRKHTIDNVTTIIPKKMNTKLKLYEPTNYNTQTLNTIISQTSPRNIAEESRDYAIHDDNIMKKIPRKIYSKLKLDVPANSNTQTVRHFAEYKNGNDKTNSSIPRILLRHPKKNIEHWDDNITTNSSRQSIFEPHRYTSLNSNIHIRKNIKKTNNLNSVNLRKSSSLVQRMNNNTIHNTYGNFENVDSTKIPTYSKNNIKNNIKSIESIKKNRNALKSKISTPIESIKTPKVKTLLDITSPSPIVNNKIISTSKLQKLLNEPKVKDSSVPLFLDKRRPITKHDLEKSLLPLKHKNTLNDRSFTKTDLIKKNNPKPNLKTKYRLDSSGLFKCKPKKIPHMINRKIDYEHAPYNSNDLKPIIFDMLTESPILSNTNSINLQFSSGNQLHNTQGLKPLPTVPIIRQEHKNYYNSQKNSTDEVKVEERRYQPGVNTSNYDPINGGIPDCIKYDVKSLKEISTNNTVFEVFSRVKVADDVFNAPLIGHTSFDNNGSAYVYDILIPIEKSDGQHSIISLTKLLTGDFHLLNEHSGHSLAVEPTSEMDSTLSLTRIPGDSTSSNTTDILFDNKAVKILQTNIEDEKLTAPVHLIQIINNGLCPDNCTKNIKKSKNNEVNSYKVQNDDKIVSCIRSSHNTPKNSKIHGRFENAYNHFDSEILDRFLQVYAPT